MDRRVNAFTIYACDNQPVLIEGLRRILEPSEDLSLVGHGPDVSAATVDVPHLKPDILLIGQPHTAKSILPILGQAREADLGAALVLWVVDLSEMDSFRALQMGARGVVRKTQGSALLLDCIRTVAGGAVYLESALRSQPPMMPRRNGVLRITPREREIIEFVCRGMKNKEIAEALTITPGTVKVHLMHIFEKTGVKDRFQLALQGHQFLSATEPMTSLRKAAEA